MLLTVGDLLISTLDPEKGAVSTVLEILQLLRYHARTSLGLYTHTFSNLDDWILGMLQESGALPCLWMAISCVLLETLINGPLGSHSPIH
jgi:hypothetical protein